MKKYIQELLGVCVIVLFGCGIASTSNTIFATSVNLPGAFTMLTVALAFGISYYMANYLFGDNLITFNPILTVCNTLNKKEKLSVSLTKILFQIIGGILGAEILGLILSNYGALGANGYGANSLIGSSLIQAVSVEVITSFILTLVYLKTGDKSRLIALPIAITFIYLFAIPYTGGGANPARSIGPALLMQEEYLTSAWVFIIFPFVGAVLAFALEKILVKSQIK